MLKKSFLLGLVAFSALGQAVADQSNCATLHGLRVGAGLGMAYGSANAKVDTTGVAKYSLEVPAAPTNLAPLGMRGQSSYKSNIGKAGLAGELFIEYLFHVGGTAYAGLGLDFHNGTSFMSARKDKDTSGSYGSSLPINTKVKSVWGFSPAVIFGLQLNPTTLLRFSIGPSFDKYKTKTTALNLPYGEYLLAYEDTGASVIQFDIPQAEIAAFNNMPFQKYNKTKVGVKLGFGIETLIHKNIVLRLSASAIFGPKIKLFDDFSKLELCKKNMYTPATATNTAEVQESPFSTKNASQKITMRRYDITVGVAYKM